MCANIIRLNFRMAPIFCVIMWALVGYAYGLLFHVHLSPHAFGYTLLLLFLLLLFIMLQLMLTMILQREQQA